MIEINNLSKDFSAYNRNLYGVIKDSFLMNEKKQKINAISNISLKVTEGEILGIIGKNGAGKSTLLKLICGLTSPTSGDIKVQGKIVALLELGSGV